LSLGKYSLLVIVVALSSLLLAWPIVLRRLDGAGRWAALYGSALAVVNTIVAHSIIRWSGRRVSTNVFLGAVLGGMVGRMGLLLVAVVVGVLALGLPKVPLAIALLTYFVLFLVLELAILHRHTPGRPLPGGSS